MRNNREKNYEKWLKKAREDELSIKAILKEGGAPSTACFLSQQMAEKYLKGLLVFYNKKFHKIHDLIELETLLSDLAPDIQNFHRELTILNRYYIETRYPGDYPEFTWSEAQKVFKSAEKIKKFVLEKIEK
ncbi:HEPN domain-containing protein [Patescibacteria group bacterium]|nr:HEPN domain-containing protein [Patescibacteria group bacterium]